jgi:hypothetical protein
VSITALYTTRFLGLPFSDDPPTVGTSDHAGEARPYLSLRAGGDTLTIHFADMADLHAFAASIYVALNTMSDEGCEHDWRPYGKDDKQAKCVKCGVVTPF